MSTTLHRPVQNYLWWYAAIAVLAGLVLALIITVLNTGSPAGGTNTTIPPGHPVTHRASPSQACFAARPHKSMELAGVCNAHPH